MRVRCVCDPHTGAGLEMSSQGLMGNRKNRKSVHQGEQSEHSQLQGGGDAGDGVRSQRSRGVQTACTSRPRSGGAMNKSTLWDQMDRGQTSFPKRERREGGRTFGKKERNWSEMPSSSMAYLLFSFFFFLIPARQGAITMELSECWKFWRTHLSTCRQVGVSLII